MFCLMPCSSPALFTSADRSCRVTASKASFCPARSLCEACRLVNLHYKPLNVDNLDGNCHIAWAWLKAK